MPFSLQTLFNERAGNTRAKVYGIYGFLLLFNLFAWLWAIVAFRHFPLLLGTAFLAYSFGLRHAVDADHIAAIDNVTRKLMQAGKRPVSVGLMFSFGHSTIVVLGSLAIAFSALKLQQHVDSERRRSRRRRGVKFGSIRRRRADGRSGSGVRARCPSPDDLPQQIAVERFCEVPVHARLRANSDLARHHVPRTPEVLLG